MQSFEENLNTKDFNETLKVNIEVKEKEMSPEDFVNFAKEEDQKFKEETTNEVSNLNSINLDKSIFEQTKIETDIDKTLHDINTEVDNVIKKSEQEVLIVSNDIGIKNEKEKILSMIDIPLTEETEEEYLSRFHEDLADKYIEGDEYLKNQHRLLKKAYYGRHATQAETEFFSNDSAREKIIETLHSISLKDNIRQSKEKDIKVLEKIYSRVNGSSKESAEGELEDKQKYYTNTNQTRDFFEKGKRHDNLAYASMMFGMSEAFLKTPEGQDYVHEHIDDKTIILLGGGDSIRDLLTNADYHPKQVINLDPYVQSETIDKNIHGIYRSETISASDPVVADMVKNGDIPKADEIWATYSVPFYLESSNDIKNLVSNIVALLDEGGNGRISPMSLQYIEKNGETFATRKEALQKSLEEITQKEDFNLTVFNNTIKIHKIKKQN